MAFVDFSWTPTSGVLTYTIGGTTYPYSTQADNISRPSDTRYVASTTPLNTALTFTAAISAGADVITEYKWDFGDGSIGYGQSIQHTYRTAVEQRAVKLTATDARGRRYVRSKKLNLTFVALTALTTNTSRLTSITLQTRG